MDLFRIPKIKQFTGGAVIRHNSEVFKATGWAGCNKKIRILLAIFKVQHFCKGHKNLKKPPACFDATE